MPLPPRALAFAALLSLPAAQADPIAPDRAARTSQKILSTLVELNGVPGMGGAVWRDGKIVWASAAGYRDLENRIPADENTIFRLASVSKIVAATAAARLAEQGRLNIDAPVQSLVPGLSPQWPAITTRQLAAHTSGIPHYQSEDENRGRTRYPTVADAVKIFNGRQLLFAPGTKYSYSSWGFTLLSATVERAADTSFLDYIARDIADGLTIGPDATDTANPFASRAYELKDGIAVRAEPHDFSYTWAGGGLGATPKALAEFGGRVLKGGLVRRQTLDWMWTPATLADGTDVAEENYRVGFGWRIGTDTDGARIVHHAGVAVGARSALVLWPERTTAASLLSNALWVSSIEQSAMMLAAPFEQAPAALVATACPVNATSYEGRFGEATVRGTANFRIEGGTCIGRLGPDAPMASYFNNGPQKDLTELAVIAVDPGTGLARAALVTPNGVYDLRAQAGGTYAAALNPKRKLTILLR
jgi:serine beta-lactamase-like protein LACTB, mitochondrial